MVAVNILIPCEAKFGAELPDQDLAYFFRILLCGVRRRTSVGFSKRLADSQERRVNGIGAVKYQYLLYVT